MIQLARGLRTAAWSGPASKPNRPWLSVRALFGLLVLVAGGPSCRGPSEEARVKGFIKGTLALAEKRDLGAVMDRLADDYLDFEGRNKTATEDLLRGYFRRTGIVIHLLSAKVDSIQAGGEAAVRFEAMVSSGAAEVFRKLVRYAGDCYRFELRLKAAPPAGWRIAGASWESVPFTALFPESLAVLKKLFPDF